MGGGYFNRTLNKDVKEINKVFLSLFSMGIILVAIFVGLNITKNSYAIFNDKIVSTNTIGVEVDTCNLYVPNEPILDNSMIPVYYDEEESVWKKADSTNESKEYEWYDYCDKKWANSVTVTSSRRSTYLNAGPGTTIDMSDILTMQVWIPRYKYKVWNYNSDGTVGSEPQEIEIVFEEGKASTGEITCTDNIQGEDGDGTSEVCRLKSTNDTCIDSTCNNKYYTHPAFTFGFEELEGFWIGKFELAGAFNNITTIPNMKSLYSPILSNISVNVMSMNDSGNQYGFSTNVDAHMIKNMEWGAVAYLSHSKYGTCDNGTCQEIGKNNNSNYITGCGSPAESSSSSTCNGYDTELGMLASTTKNIYGVYDMSGGAIEYVMGNMVSIDGEQMMSGNSVTSNSKFTGIIYDFGNYTLYTGDYNYPLDKYYDKYSFGTTTSKSRGKLGDATKEVYTGTSSWYGGNSGFVNVSYVWVARGGFVLSSNKAGIFYFTNSTGHSTTYLSSRIIIVP